MLIKITISVRISVCLYCRMSDMTIQSLRGVLFFKSRSSFTSPRFLFPCQLNPKHLSTFDELPIFPIFSISDRWTPNHPFNHQTNPQTIHSSSNPIIQQTLRPILIFNRLFNLTNQTSHPCIEFLLCIAYL